MNKKPKMQIIDENNKIKIVEVNNIMICPKHFPERYILVFEIENKIYKYLCPYKDYDCVRDFIQKLTDNEVSILEKQLQLVEGRITLE
jgi:hypothetical protein